MKPRLDSGEPPLKISKVEPKESVDEVEKPRREKPRHEVQEIVHVDYEGKKEIHITLSPKHSTAEAPEPEELIRALQGLENAPSCDAVVRERIAKFPAEVSDVGLLTKISGNLRIQLSLHLFR